MGAVCCRSVRPRPRPLRLLHPTLDCPPVHPHPPLSSWPTLRRLAPQLTCKKPPRFSPTRHPQQPAQHRPALPRASFCSPSSLLPPRVNGGAIVAQTEEQQAEAGSAAPSAANAKEADDDGRAMTPVADVAGPAWNEATRDNRSVAGFLTPLCTRRLAAAGSREGKCGNVFSHAGMHAVMLAGNAADRSCMSPRDRRSSPVHVIRCAGPSPQRAWLLCVQIL